MYTTDHTELATKAGNRENRAGTNKVTKIDALKRRKWLGNLLATRRHLADVAVQQRSHGIDEDAEESFSLQLIVEQTIQDEFPEQYAEQFPTWLERDASGEHASEVLTAGCGICRAIASARGLNLEAPEAA